MPNPGMPTPGPTEWGRQSGHAPSPKSAGGNPDAPPPQLPRADCQRAQDEADDEFRERRRLPSVATPGTRQGRPPNNVMFPTEEPKRFLERPIFAIDLNHVPPNHIFIRGHVNDSLRAALVACMAQKAIRKLGADRELEVRLLPRIRRIRPFLRALFTWKASVAGAWELVWGHM